MITSSGLELCPALPVEEPMVWRLRISGMEILFLANETRALVSVQMTDGRRLYAETAIGDSTPRASDYTGRKPVSILAL
jgi:hypothetical protein